MVRHSIVQQRTSRRGLTSLENVLKATKWRTFFFAFWDKKFPAIARLSHVSKEWFLQQYEDKSLTKMVVVTNPFRVQLKTLTIRKQESSFIPGMPSSTKRERVEDNEGKWVDTKPVHITCLSGLSESHRILVNAFEEKIEALESSSSLHSSQDANENQNGANEEEITST